MKRKRDLIYYGIGLVALCIMAQGTAEFAGAALKEWRRSHSPPAEAAPAGHVEREEFIRAMREPHEKA